jgi:HD superfamily phosphohydrolase
MNPREGIAIDPSDPMQRVIKGLMDTPLLQRSDHIGQLATAHLVFRDGNHSRFGHSVGSALLTAELLGTISARSSDAVRAQIKEWGPAVVAFAMLHDGGHIAPGSHLAHRVWFPGQPDSHEALSRRIIEEDLGLRVHISRAIDPSGYQKLCKIIKEPENDPSVPRWTWQIITGGGFNADRGDWVQRDAEQCGVQYGNYDLLSIKKGLVITEAGDLALKEKAVPTLNSFFVSRADMYLNVYNHETCRVGARMMALIGQRARELFDAKEPLYADETMKGVLSAKNGLQLELPVVLNMTESWWQQHVNAWAAEGNDAILKSLCNKLIKRELFKIVNPKDSDFNQLRTSLRAGVSAKGLDPKYFLIEEPPLEVDLARDLRKAIKVVTASGKLCNLTECSQFLQALSDIEKIKRPGFFAVDPVIFAPAPARAS